MKSTKVVRRIFMALLGILLLLIPCNLVKAESESVSSDEDFVIEDGVLIKYKGSASTVVIPEGVTKIDCLGLTGKNGLNYTDTIHRVVLPKSLKEIGNHAFYMCTGLSEIEMQEGITTIGSHAFAECRSLTEVNIPEGVTTIERKAFWNCENLSQINIPESVTTIGDSYTFGLTPWMKAKEEESDMVIVNNVLVSCHAKGEVTIPEGVTKLASGAIISAATEVYLPESLTEIGSYAFKTRKLKAVHMNGNVTKIGEAAFYYFDSLKELEIPKSVKEMGGDIFGEIATENLPILLVYKDSVGHSYAVENNLKYRLLDAGPGEAEPETDGANFIVKVQRGDTLWGISYTHLGSGLRYEEIMKFNGLKNTTIYAGQKLKVPAK